ncbi:MAG: LysR family transcriptional regulator [Bacilli bacterium]|nr:LysR family transcriptional regulator [Bacilli bacterium]
MNIDFELYRIFYVVANNKNITKASNELHISQPAISKSIKNLENMLGGQLFTRTKRGVILTDEGEEFYKYIKQGIEYINSAENKFTELINLDTGVIKIGASTTLSKEFLLPYIEYFHEKYPKIDIQISTNIYTELLQKLRNGLIDLIISFEPDKIDNDLNVIRCKEVHDAFVVGEKYKNLANKKIELKDLSNYPLVFQTDVSNTRKFLNKYLNANNVLLKPNVELASYTLVRDFTIINMGIGYVVKEFVEQYIKDKKLYVLNIKPSIPSRYIEIITSKTHLPNFSTKKLIEIITKK